MKILTHKQRGVSISGNASGITVGDHEMPKNLSHTVCHIEYLRYEAEDVNTAYANLSWYAVNKFPTI